MVTVMGATATIALVTVGLMLWLKLISGQPPSPLYVPSRRGWNRPATRVVGLMMAITAIGLAAGCARMTSRESGCTAQMPTLPASGSSSMIAVIPRTSAEAASWGLQELAHLLPFAARAGLELHVLYSQDNDDLGEGGGDGEPAQVFVARAPRFPDFQITGAPESPLNPTALTARLYCKHLAAWHVHASQELHTELLRRAALVAAWVRTSAASLTALADKPIPDTLGMEAGGEIDAGASIFAAAQVAQAAPHPTILVLGGLTALKPPSVSFQFPARLVALTRSSDPGQVLRAESAWTRSTHRFGGRFEALSSNDSLTAIAGALDGKGKVR